MDLPEILQELDEEARAKLLALIEPERDCTWEDCMVCPDFLKCGWEDEDAE
jgi:hypothetical protein